MSNQFGNAGSVIVLGLVVIILLLLLLALLRWLLRPARGEEVAHNYMASRQINLLAEHAPGLNPAAIAQAIADDPVLSDDRLRGFFVPPERIATFAVGATAFSLAPVVVPRAAEPAMILRLVDTINSQLRDRPRQEPPGPGQAPKDPAPTPQQPAPGGPRLATRAQLGAPAGGAVVLRQAGANWLANAAGAHNGPGSPGARPIAVPPGELNLAEIGALDLISFAIPADLLAEIGGQGAGDPVDVFILDTLPGGQELADAYARWSGSEDPAWPYPRNRMIADLLAPGGPLQDRRYAGASHLLDQVDFDIPSHNYVMSDHGLFVASIVHAIAPSARLHMVEVLNPYGVGSLESIARGFAVAAEQVAPGAKLLVNASLALDLPTTSEADWLEYVMQQDPFWSQFTPEQLFDSADTLRRICALFRAGGPAGGEFPNVGVIAAAGNDNRPGMAHRPPARYPAAFDGVLGIGALNHDIATETIYTNRADTVPDEAIWTFGGEKSPTSDDADPTYGLAGPYIGALPDGTPNITGAARWAGTSFAAPIITGLMAALMSQPGVDFAAAEKRIRQAYPH
jgi:hypothetical protein